MMITHCSIKKAMTISRHDEKNDLTHSLITRNEEINMIVNVMLSSVYLNDRP